MSTLAEQYYASWQTNRSPAGLELFLARFPGLNLAELIEVVLMDQALQWQAGPGASVEQYLERFPAVSDQRHAVLELVYGEMRVVRALGGPPVDVEAYVARFPDLADPLRRQMEVSAWLLDRRAGVEPTDRSPP
jgi:hypothetical protein